MADPPLYAIAPIDRCYMLVGLVKASLGGDLRRRRRRGGDRRLLRRARGRWRREHARGHRRRRSRPSRSSRCSARAGRRHAAVPALDFDVHVSEPGGRHVYAIALSAQIMIEPARRAYDAETREKLVELFGAPERWATTTRSLVWHQADALVPAFTGRDHASASPCRPASTWRSPRRSTSTALPDGEVPLAFNFNGTVHYRGDDGRLQMSLVPVVVLGRVPAAGRALARADRPLLPAQRLDRAPGATRSRRSSARRRARGLPTLDACVAELLEDAVTSELVDTLLYEGYALYPVHAGRDEERDADAVRDRLPARLRADARQRLRPPRAAVRRRGRRRRGRRRGALPAPSGERHRAEAQRSLPVPATSRSAGCACARALEAIDRAERPAATGRVLRVENRTEVAGRARPRRGAAPFADLDAPLLAVEGGRFVSQLDAACDSVNTWPVLASPEDDVMLGAAIILPDHPQIAPESRGNLFDNTEIEEALVLHVQVLSDGERAEIERAGPGRARDDRARRRGHARGAAPAARARGAARPVTTSRRGRRRTCATRRAGCPRSRWTA